MSPQIHAQRDASCAPTNNRSRYESLSLLGLLELRHENICAENNALRAENKALRARLAEEAAVLNSALERAEARIHGLSLPRVGPFLNADTGLSGPNMSIGNVARSHGPQDSPAGRETRDSVRPIVGGRAGLHSSIVGASDPSSSLSLLQTREASGADVRRDRGRPDRAQHPQADNEPPGSRIGAVAREAPRVRPPMLVFRATSRRPGRGRGSSRIPLRRSPRPRSTQPDRTTNEHSHGGPPRQQGLPSNPARSQPHVPMSPQLRGANTERIRPNSSVTNADMRPAPRAESLQHKAAIDDDAPAYE